MNSGLGSLLVIMFKRVKITSFILFFLKLLPIDGYNVLNLTYLYWPVLYRDFLKCDYGFGRLPETIGGMREVGLWKNNPGTFLFAICSLSALSTERLQYIFYCNTFSLVLNSGARIYSFWNGIYWFISCKVHFHRLMTSTLDFRVGKYIIQPTRLGLPIKKV